MSRAFGRDEMNALLGGRPDEDAVLFRPPAVSQPNSRPKREAKEDVDISKLSAEETAALLHESKSRPGGAGSISNTRYRTGRVLAHHQLALELSNGPRPEGEAQPPQPTKPLGNIEKQGDTEEDFEVVLERGKGGEKKKDRASSDRAKTKYPAPSKKKRRRHYDSSSSSDAEHEGEGGKRAWIRGERTSNMKRVAGKSTSSSSSSDDDDEVGRRRRLRLGVRRRGVIEEPRQRIEPVIVSHRGPKPKPASEDLNPNVKRTDSRENKPNLPKRKFAKQDKLEVSGRDKETGSEGTDSGSSTSTSTSSSGEDSSSSGEDSSDSGSSGEDEQMMAKPVFVPKSKRNLVSSDEKKSADEELRQKREEERVRNRKMESRAMVAKHVSSVVQVESFTEIQDEESGGATNDRPNDEVEIDIEIELDAWEVRELERLLIFMDNEKQLEREKIEYERRRRMTDEECLKEDMSTGRYEAPGSRGRKPAHGHYMQRFFHRGAYYMDDTEWDETDVRHKAAEYAVAATGEDKVDKSQLPKVMQVKKFGFARQNNKYKGLAREDTTDKSMDLLPLARKKGSKERRLV